MMSLAHTYRSNGGHFHKDGRSAYARTSNMGIGAASATINGNHYYYPYSANLLTTKHDFSNDLLQHFAIDQPIYDQISQDLIPSYKRRKLSAVSCDSTVRSIQQQTIHDNHADERNNLPFSYLGDYSNATSATEKSLAAVSQTRTDDGKAGARTAPKRDRSQFEDDEVVMSRDEIDKHSPSRKDGIDALQETHLRYSYCTFLQNLGVRLDLPQTTVGTAMVLCHRFFARRSHASHDRFLIATASLFLASKSEETPRPLNDVLRVSCEVFHRQDFTFLSYMFPVDWFEQYRERITEAEQLILTTLNFELNVQHPYEPLTSTLQKIGFAQSILVKMALNLVSEGDFICMFTLLPHRMPLNKLKNFWRCSLSYILLSVIVLTAVQLYMMNPVASLELFVSDYFDCRLALYDERNTGLDRTIT